MNGTHFTADCYGCQADLADLHFVTQICKDAILGNGLTIVGASWTKFPDWQGQPGGVTGALVLAESHLAIHTWPETGNVTIDIYVCNFTKDNSHMAKKALAEIIEALEVKTVVHNSIIRGNIRQEFREDLNDTSFFGTSGSVIHHTTSKFQDIKVLNTEFGKTLVIDDVFMTSETDEAIYHESMVQMPLLCLPYGEKVVILGGGDGGAAREAIRMGKSPVVLELDPEVVRVSEKYLGIDQGALSDPRTTIVCGDAMGTINKYEGIDLLVLDLTDPRDHAFPLYSESAITKFHKKLAPGGILSMHLGSPVHHKERTVELYNRLLNEFKYVRLMGAYIPMYGSYWLMALASDTPMVPRDPIPGNKFLTQCGMAHLTSVPLCFNPNSGS